MTGRSIKTNSLLDMILSAIDSKQPFQAEYVPVIRELVHFMKNGLGKNLHSIYLYGSVARKTARPDSSGVDIVVVTHRGFEEQRATLVNTIKWRFQKAYPFVKSLSFKTALVGDVASLESIFSWGFLLRHCSVCVYGENLSECFGDFEPSWEIAKHWNNDLEDWLAVYRHRIGRADNDAAQINAQKVIAKKLLRASYSLVIPQDKNWFDDPIDCGRQFLKYHPDKQLEIERLGLLLQLERAVPKRSVVGLIDSYGDWLLKQYKRTEFKIG